MATVCLLSAGIAMAAKSRKPQDKHYEHAIELIAQGDHKGGILELQTALQTDPTDVAARVLLGNTYLEIEDGDHAAEHLLQARKDGADDSFVIAPLANAYVLQGQHDEALKELSKADKYPSLAAKVAAIRGDAHLGLGQYKQAEQSYLASLKIRPKYSKALNGLAKVKIETKDLASAGIYAERALEVQPSDRFAWFAKGEIARLRRDMVGALNNYDRAVELAPRYVPPRLARARISIDQGRFRMAEPDILAIRKLDQDNPHAAFLHALILAEKGEVTEAQDILIRAKSMLEGSPVLMARPESPTLFLLGVAAYFHKDYPSAYRHLTAFLKHVPRHLGAMKLLASLALSSGDTDYALHLLEALAPRAPEDIDVLSMYGDALMRVQRHKDAIRVFEKSASMKNPAYPALSRLVGLRSVAGQNADAKKFRKVEISRDPLAVKATLLMSATLLNQREFDRAIEIAASVIELYPENAVAHNLVGSARVGLEEFDKARSSFRAAIEAAPKYFLAFTNLARLEFRQGNLPAAERLYNFLVEQDSGNGMAMMALAEIDVLRDDMGSARRWLEKARRKSHTPSQAALHLIDFHIYANEPEKALSLARELIGGDPANLDYLTALGRARLAANRTALAAVTFQEVSVRASELKSIKWLVRNSVWQMRALDEHGARSSLTRALQLDNKSFAAHVQFFKLEMAANKIEAALARAVRVAELDRLSPLGDMLQGDAYMRLQKYDSALRSYDEALKKSRNYPQVVRAYRARRAAGRGAVEFAEIWARQRPDDRAAQRLLAMAYDEAGRKEEAIAIYERLLAAEPRDIRILTSMAVSYQKHDPSKALDYAERAFRTAPAEAVVMDTYGWILVQQGSLDEGLTLLRKAKLRAPDALEIRYHMAVALNKMDKHQEARLELRAALQTGQYFPGADEARHLLSALDIARR